MTRRTGSYRSSLFVVWVASTMIVAAAASAQEYRMGPSGGAGGELFSDEVPNAASSQVSEVRLWIGKQIDAIQMVHRTEAGPNAFTKHGGPGGSVSVFKLEPGEVLTAMSGRYGATVDQVRFHTSTGRSSPVYGKDAGAGQFRYEAPPGTEIAGFIGRAGNLLDALGIILRPIEYPER